MIHKAETIFKESDFTKSELDKIFLIAAGRLIDFSHPRPLQKPITPFLIQYARGEKFKNDLPISVRRFYQILAAERKSLCQERILYWQEQGLLIRHIARLFKISIPTLQRILKGENNGHE
jgi:hypothetical protein